MILIRVKFRKPKHRDYFLREYSHIARIRHFCMACCQDINPGGRYYALVWAGPGGIYVFKTHDKCPPNPDLEEFEKEMCRDSEKNREERQRTVSQAA